MAVSPARTAILPIKTRTPAREAHADYLRRLAVLRSTAAEGRRPLDRALDQLEHAQASVRTAEAALAAVDAKETALITAWDSAGSPWPPPSPPAGMKQARAEAEDALAVTRRTLVAVQRNAEATRGPAERAAAAAGEFAKETDSKVRDILMEIADTALAQLVEARINAAKIEGAIRSLAAAMAAKEWFSAAEHVNMAIYKMREPEPPSQCSFVRQPHLPADYRRRTPNSSFRDSTMSKKQQSLGRRRPVRGPSSNLKISVPIPLRIRSRTIRRILAGLGRYRG